MLVRVKGLAHENSYKIHWKISSIKIEKYFEKLVQKSQKLKELSNISK
jgi:hypothetical protein